MWNFGQSRIYIPSSHPCLPGHFPGNPIVPGVLILAVIQTAFVEENKQANIVSWSKVKFLEMLLPDQSADIQFLASKKANRVRFLVVANQVKLVQGEFMVEPRSQL